MFAGRPFVRFLLLEETHGSIVLHDQKKKMEKLIVCSYREPLWKNIHLPEKNSRPIRITLCTCNAPVCKEVRLALMGSSSSSRFSVFLLGIQLKSPTALHLRSVGGHP